MSMLGHYASYVKGELPDGNEEDIIGLFERHECSPTGVIHVGAHECPELTCYAKLFDTNVIWVEANGDTYTNSVVPVAEENGHQAYNFAAYDEDDLELTLYIPSRSDISSLYTSSEFPHTHTSQVRTKTLDTLVEEEKIDMKNFNFLNVDVEGAELRVLEGFKNNLCHIQYLFIEVSVGERFADSGATFEILHNYAVEKGFELREISSSIQTLGWGDAFYIRP